LVLPADRDELSSQQGFKFEVIRMYHGGTSAAGKASWTINSCDFPISGSGFSFNFFRQVVNALRAFLYVSDQRERSFSFPSDRSKWVEGTALMGEK